MPAVSIGTTLSQEFLNLTIKCNHNERGAKYEIPNVAPVEIYQLFWRADANVDRQTRDTPPKLALANVPWECGGERHHESSTRVGAHVPDAMNCSPKRLLTGKK